MLLIAGVGYQFLGDLSFGPKLVERLQGMDWPEWVRVEDFGYGPLAILDWFEESPGKTFERAILAGAVEREREPGTLTTYGWVAHTQDPDLVQERILEAGAGVISLENLLIVAQWFDALPADTQVVELEPEEKGWNMGLSALGEERLEQAVEWIQSEVHPGARHSGNGREEVRKG
ncbi:MAG: hydrogenase maturation protease [Actinomycetota bacterium]|nr:hydrogenase maturation protease [Actinomycetota bacterium]